MASTPRNVRNGLRRAVRSADGTSNSEHDRAAGSETTVSSGYGPTYRTKRRQRRENSSSQMSQALASTHDADSDSDDEMVVEHGFYHHTLAQIRHFTGYILRPIFYSLDRLSGWLPARSLVPAWTRRPIPADLLRGLWTFAVMWLWCATAALICATVFSSVRFRTSQFGVLMFLPGSALAGLALALCWFVLYYHLYVCKPVLHYAGTRWNRSIIQELKGTLYRRFWPTPYACHQVSLRVYHTAP